MTDASDLSVQKFIRRLSPISSIQTYHITLYKHDTRHTNITNAPTSSSTFKLHTNKLDL